MRRLLWTAFWSMAVLASAVVHAVHDMVPCKLPSPGDVIVTKGVTWHSLSPRPPLDGHVSIPKDTTMIVVSVTTLDSVRTKTLMNRVFNGTYITLTLVVDGRLVYRSMYSQTMWTDYELVVRTG